MKQPSGMAELYCLSGTTASADRFIILDIFGSFCIKAKTNVNHSNSMI